jgi:hypothetical protein
MRQQTLAMTTGFERYSKKTRRALFLEEMEQVVPWRELCALVEPHYPKAGKVFTLCALSNLFVSRRRLLSTRMA